MKDSIKRLKTWVKKVKKADAVIVTRENLSDIEHLIKAVTEAQQIMEASRSWKHRTQCAQTMGCQCHSMWESDWLNRYAGDKE